MSSLITRVARRLVALTVVALVACQAEDRLAPDGAPGTPPPDLAPYAFYLDIDVANGTVRVVSPEPAQSRADSRLAYSLAGSEIVGMTTSNFFRSAIGQFVLNKRTVTFDITLNNKLSVTDLVTPTFPLPPAGVQGIIAFPYTVAAYGVSGGRALPDTSWNGTGGPGGGAPVNFFNDFGVCGTATTSDCYRWEAFPTPLNPGQSTPAQKVGFTVDKNVTNVGVYVVVAADLVDHAPPPPPPGLGALSGVVTSASLGLLGGVSVTLAPGGQSAVTDGVGRYLFTGLPVGPFTVTASGLPSGCTAPASVSGMIVSGGLATANFDVACQPTTGTISGMATSPQVGPLASATVQLLTPAGIQVAQTTTNAAGAFSFSGVAPGSYQVQLVGLTPPCPPTPGSVAVTVTAGATSNPTFSVSCVGTGNGTISGQVLSPPFGPYVFEISFSSSGGGSVVPVFSDPVTGSYGPVTIAAGQVTVRVTSFPLNCTAPFGQTVSVAAGAPVTVNFSVTCGDVQTTGSINGSIISPQLGPLGGATVQLLQAGTLTLVSQTPTFATSGAFFFGGIAPGNYLVQVVGLTPPCPATAGPLAVTVAVSSVPTPTFTVSCVATISGTVTSPQLGPLSVQLSLSSSGGGSAVPALSSPVTGAYGPIAIAAGQVAVALSTVPSGCSVPPTQTVSVADGASVTVNFSVTCPPLLTGVVTSSTGGPLDGVTVTATNLTGSFTALTDASGAFSFDNRILVITGLPTSVSLTITAGLPAGCAAPTTPTTVLVIAGTPASVTIPVACGGTAGSISGTATSPEVGPLATATVQLLTPAGIEVAQTTTNATGAFSFSGVAPGNYQVQVIGLTPPCPATGGPVSVTVIAGITSSANISVSCVATGSGTISGTVTSPQLGGIAFAAIAASSSPSGATASGQTDLLGAYGPLSIAAGQVTVSMSSLPTNCTPPSAQTVTLAANGAAAVNFVVDCPALGPAQITVQVTSPQLGPLPGVAVYFASPYSSYSINTDATGSATVDASVLSGFADIQLVSGLPPGCATPAAITVTPPAAGTLFVPIPVTCSVASGTGGLNLFVGNVQALALAGALLDLSGPSGYQLRTATDPSGVLLLSGLAPGDYSGVLLGLPAACTQLPLSFTITAGAITQAGYSLQCAISMVPGVIGDVISPTLGILSGVAVDLYEGGAVLGSTQTDGNGVFSFARNICGPTNCLGHILTVSFSPTNPGLPLTCTVPPPIGLAGKGSGFFASARFSVDCN